MKIAPWGQVKSWNCVRCGECCKLTVQLTTREWLNLTGLYGPQLVDQHISGFYMRKTIEDQCPFLQRLVDRWICNLQAMKPLACKLWPFRICDNSRYGKPDEAYFNYKNEEFYIYLYPVCPGIIWGKPTPEFTYRILPEVIDIRLGTRREQVYSTSRIKYLI